jgi:RNA polymerase sigma-70 factor, ECF subfamily
VTSESTFGHHDLDDVALLQAHRDGNPDAFGVLVTRHRDRLWAVALRTTGNPEDAADALQDALISAYRGADSFRGDALVTTWLHRVVVNACLDRLRRNKVRAGQPLPDDIEQYAARGAVLGAGAEVGPEATALRTDQRKALLAALDRLSADQKAAIVLVDMEGYPVDEVARMLDCPVGTVKSRCARGRHRLAQLLADMSVTGTGRGRAPSDQRTPARGSLATDRQSPARPDEGGAKHDDR